MNTTMESMLADDLVVSDARLSMTGVIVVVVLSSLLGLAWAFFSYLDVKKIDLKNSQQGEHEQGLNEVRSSIRLSCCWSWARRFQSPVTIGHAPRSNLHCSSPNPFNRQHLPNCKSEAKQREEGFMSKQPLRKTIDVNININININANAHSNFNSYRRQQSVDSTAKLFSKAQKPFDSRQRTPNPEFERYQYVEHSEYTPHIARINQKKQMARGKSEPAFPIYTQKQSQAFQTNSSKHAHTKATNSTASRSILSSLHNIGIKTSPLQHKISPLQLNTFRSNNINHPNGQNAPSFIVAPVQLPAQSNRPTHNSLGNIRADNTCNAPSYIPLAPLQVMQPYIFEGNMEQLNQEKHESNQFSEVQTFKMHFNYTSPIKQTQQLTSNGNLPIHSAKRFGSKGKILSQNRLVTISSQESLTVNKGIENYINPEDFVGNSLSSIRSIPQRIDSSSLQKVNLGMFLRRNEPIKSNTQQYHYIIQQQSQNAQNSSCGTSSNLKSSMTSVAQQLKVRENQYALKGFNSSQSVAKLQRSLSNGLNEPTNASPKNTFEYRFDRKLENNNNRHRDRHNFKPIPKTRVPINNLALWDMQVL